MTDREMQLEAENQHLREELSEAKAELEEFRNRTPAPCLDIRYSRINSMRECRHDSP